MQTQGGDGGGEKHANSIHTLYTLDTSVLDGIQTQDPMVDVLTTELPAMAKQLAFLDSVWPSLLLRAPHSSWSIIIICHTSWPIGMCVRSERASSVTTTKLFPIFYKKNTKKLTFRHPGSHKVQDIGGSNYTHNVFAVEPQAFLHLCTHSSLITILSAFLELS